MDSNLQSEAPDKSNMKPSFRKPSNDAVNRKYRRHSPVDGSNSSYDDSPIYQRSPSPSENGKKFSDNNRYKRDDPIDSDRVNARDRSGRDGDPYRPSERQSYRDSRDSRKADDSTRYYMRADEDERNYSRSSSRYGQGTRCSDHSDRSAYGDHNKLRENQRRSREYEKSRYIDKDRDTKYSSNDLSTDRSRHENKQLHSNKSEPKTRESDKFENRSADLYDDRDLRRKNGDYKSSHKPSSEDSRRYSRNEMKGRDGYVLHSKETYVDNIKELDDKKGVSQRRKHDDRDYVKKARDNSDLKANANRSNNSGCSDPKERDGHYQSKDIEEEAVPIKKMKTGFSDKAGSYVEEEKYSVKSSGFSNIENPSSSKQDQPSVASVKEVVAVQDLNAAKFAALKAAEMGKFLTQVLRGVIFAKRIDDIQSIPSKILPMRETVNRNLIGSGYLSTDQKKKLLWGNKNTTEEGNRWEIPLFADQDRQEKFNKLMGVKGEIKAEKKVDGKDTSELLRAEKQEQLQLDLEKQYTAGLRRRDGRTVGLGL